MKYSLSTSSSYINHLATVGKSRGFTIVELLIVIVVIGILAAIVIVAYTGITSRANTSKAQANATSTKKVAEAISADTGSYPATKAAFTAGSTSTKLPAGVSLVSGPAAAFANQNLAAVATQAGTDLPASSNTSTAFNTIAVYGITGNLTSGGVIYYRGGDNSVQGPIFYGAASSTNNFDKLP